MRGHDPSSKPLYVFLVNRFMFFSCHFIFYKVALLKCTSSASSELCSFCSEVSLLQRFKGLLCRSVAHVWCSAPLLEVSEYQIPSVCQSDHGHSHFMVWSCHQFLSRSPSATPCSLTMLKKKKGKKELFLTFLFTFGHFFKEVSKRKGWNPGSI